MEADQLLAEQLTAYAGRSELVIKRRLLRLRLGAAYEKGSKVSHPFRRLLKAARVCE